MFRVRGFIKMADLNWDFDELFIRELADRIPDDMTWDDYRINKEFDND